MDIKNFCSRSFLSPLALPNAHIAVEDGPRDSIAPAVDAESRKHHDHAFSFEVDYSHIQKHKLWKPWSRTLLSLFPKLTGFFVRYHGTHSRVCIVAGQPDFSVDVRKSGAALVVWCCRAHVTAGKQLPGAAARYQIRRLVRHRLVVARPTVLSTTSERLRHEFHAWSVPGTQGMRDTHGHVGRKGARDDSVALREDSVLQLRLFILASSPYARAC